MAKFLVSVILNFYLFCIFSSPPRQIPSELVQQFTMDGEVTVFDWYVDNTIIDETAQYEGNYCYRWSSDKISNLIQKAQRKEQGYYGNTDDFLYASLKENQYFKDKEVAIIGSMFPWYEAIVLAYGGSPVTIEYNDITCNDPRITAIKPFEALSNKKKYDVILTVSSIEHDGLGRFGDPVDPWGDLKAMAFIKTILNKDGVCILAVPIGRKDVLCWNRHRIYGPKRLPKLFEGWEIIKAYGFSSFSDASRDITNYQYQPIFILKLKEG